MLQGTLDLVPSGATADSYIQIGATRGGSGASYVDLIGDVTYTDYGMRHKKPFLIFFTLIYYNYSYLYFVMI